MISREDGDPSPSEMDRLVGIVNDARYSDPRIDTSRLSLLGVRFTSRQIFLMLEGEEGRTARKYAVALGASVITALDILDDIVDKTPDRDKRLGIYDTAAEHFIKGVCNCGEGKCTPVYGMCQYLHEMLHGTKCSLASTLNVITNVGRNQITSSSVLEHEMYMRQMGESCMLLLLQACETIRKQAAPNSIRNAVGQLGIAAYMQDLAYEVDDDLAASNPTYVTLRIQNNEPSSTVVNDVLRQAKLEMRLGKDELSGLPRYRYELLWRLMSFKNQHL